MRVLGTLAVVLQHVAHRGALHSALYDTSDWWFCQAVVVATKWAVPVFIILSGGLLLDPKREMEIASFYRRRVMRVGIPLVAWSLFYSALKVVLSKFTLPAAEIVHRLAMGRPYYHMYFLFVIAGLYVITPILRAFVARAPRWLRMGFIVLSITVAMSEGALGLWENDPLNALTLFLPYLGYFLLGNELISLRLSSTGLKCLGAICVATMAMTLAGTWAWIHVAGPSAQSRYLISYLSPTVAVMSMGAYLLISNTWNRWGIASRLLKWWAPRCAPACLGIYLVHPFFLTAFRRLGFSSLRPSPWLGVPVTAAALFLISWAAVEAMRSLPGGRVVVGG